MAVLLHKASKHETKGLTSSERNNYAVAEAAGLGT